jgi:hypothetical protein
VIYLTLSMTFAVRALSLLLIMWLAAAASFPPCCWAIAGAHDDHAQQQASAPSPDMHEHHHDGGTDVVAAPADFPLMSAASAHNCDTESVEALVTPRTQLSFVGLPAARAASAGIFTPQVSAACADRSDVVPPGASPGSAFLNPLRL